MRRLSACHTFSGFFGPGARLMTFTTITFLVFLSIVFALYRSLRTVRQQNVLLIGAGLRLLRVGWCNSLGSVARSRYMRAAHMPDACRSR